MASLPARKRALRATVQHTLRQLTPSAVDRQSQDLFRKITTTEPYLSARSLAVYLAMPAAEVQTLALVRHALQAGKAVWVPFIPAGGKGPMTMVRVYDDELDGAWERDKWGIPVVGRDRPDERGPREDVLDPPPSSPPLDLIYVPAVAFAPSPVSPTAIDRLGHGKGYYDTFLLAYARLCAERARVPPTMVGLALREQFLPRGAVPTGAHDVPLVRVLVADDDGGAAADGGGA